MFNPTCFTQTLDAYAVLVVKYAPPPLLGDGDWSAATSVSFPAGATLAVRATRASSCARQTRR